MGSCSLRAMVIWSRRVFRRQALDLFPCFQEPQSIACLPTPTLHAVPGQVVRPGGGGQGQPSQYGSFHAGVLADVSVDGLAGGGEVEPVHGACPADTLEQLRYKEGD